MLLRVHAMMFVLSFAFALACKPEATFATIEEDCRVNCEFSWACADTFSQEQIEKCVADCLDYKDQSIEQGRECALAYEGFVHCIATIEDCEERVFCAVRLDTNPCAAEAAVYDRDCREFYAPIPKLP